MFFSPLMRDFSFCFLYKSQATYFIKKAIELFLLKQPEISGWPPPRWADRITPLDVKANLSKSQARETTHINRSTSWLGWYKTSLTFPLQFKINIFFIKQYYFCALISVESDWRVDKRDTTILFALIRCCSDATASCSSRCQTIHWHFMFVGKKKKKKQTQNVKSHGGKMILQGRKKRMPSKANQSLCMKKSCFPKFQEANGDKLNMLIKGRQ